MNLKWPVLHESNIHNLEEKKQKYDEHFHSRAINFSGIGSEQNHKSNAEKYEPCPNSKWQLLRPSDREIKLMFKKSLLKRESTPV